MKSSYRMKSISFSILLAIIAALAMYVPLYGSDTDSRIESAAKNSYVFKTYLKNDDIKVDSKNGVVTLTGSVKDEYHKSLAQETVAGLPDVKDVNNHLEIKGEQAAKGSDAWLSAKVKSALLFHKNVSALHTDVDVNNGIVTLRGPAENDAQKQLATEYAKEVEGVKDVKNEMVVSTPNKKTETFSEDIDDASITAQVKTTLLFHKATSALNTKVVTNNGIVTLSGKAKNGAEKDLVTKLVEDVQGVKKVVNDMTVDVSSNN